MKQTILVVEDEPDVMNLLRHILKHYNLIEATNADQALRLAARLPNRIALLVADVDPRKTLGPIIGKAAVIEEMADVPVKAVLVWNCLKRTNFLQRRGTTDESQA